MHPLRRCSCPPSHHCTLLNACNAAQLNVSLISLDPKQATRSNLLFKPVSAINAVLSRDLPHSKDAAPISAQTRIPALQIHKDSGKSEHLDCGAKGFWLGARKHDLACSSV